MTVLQDASEPPLTTLGLTPYGARVYLALARSWRPTASQVADGARIPRQRVYDVLEDLIGRGLVLRLMGKPCRYEAVDPAEALSRLMAANQEVLTRQAVLADRLVTELRPAWLRSRHGHPALQPASPSGQITVASVGQWREFARHSILATTRPPFAGIEDPSWLQHVERLTRRGGTVRCIYQSDVLADPRLLANARRFAAAGEEARVMKSVPTRMILTDGCRAMLPIPSAGDLPPSDAVLLIEHEDVVTRLGEDFELMWTRATPLPEADS